LSYLEIIMSDRLYELRTHMYTELTSDGSELSRLRISLSGTDVWKPLLVRIYYLWRSNIVTHSQTLRVCCQTHAKLISELVTSAAECREAFSWRLPVTVHK
jgi:hypothetical protein